MARTAHYNEIAEMLRNMPRGWSREYRKGRDQLADAGGPVLPNVPTPEQAMQLVGITAGGNLSGDVPYGPHKVPKDVRDAAMKGIRLSYREGYGAWAFIGLARAIELVLADGVSERTVKRMRDYLRRHAVDKGAPGFGDDRKPSRGYMAWLNWGGDPAVNWTRLFQPNPLRNPRRRRPVESDETYLEGVERRERRKGRGERAFDTAQTAGSLAVAGAKLGGRAIPVVGEVLMVAGAGKAAVKVARRRLKGGKGSWQSDIAKIGAGALGLESFVPEAQPRKNPRRRNPRDPQTDTAAFRRWFGASKVVDARGAPLVVYHGTAYAPGQPYITEFRGPHQPFRYPATPGGKFVGVGSFFSESEEVARSYPRYAPDTHVRMVHPVYLHIRRPMVYRTARAAADDMVARSGGDPVAFVRALQAEGYDGITFTEGPSYAPRDASKKARVWVTFSPAQVRHVHPPKAAPPPVVEDDDDDWDDEDFVGNPRRQNPRRRNPRDPQTDTAAFRRWFGASKVVDERGAPLVVYHGSKKPGHDVFLPRSIKQAGTGEALSGRGVYFTSERDFAEHYAGKTGGVYSVYLKIKRPFVRGKSIWGEEAIDVALRYITAAVSARYAESKIGPLRRGQFLEDVLPPDTVTEMLLADGYDGVVDGHIYVALDPTQIKSATNNVGTFDPDDPSILRNPRRSGTTAERTDPALWEAVKREVTAGSKGGVAGEWSARKAQLAVALYKKRGGGYIGPKSPRNSLAKWTREDWRTRSGEPSLVTGERYLPARAIAALSPQEYAATTRAKREGMRRGEQFVAQPARIREKTARYRKNPGRC